MCRCGHCLAPLTCPLPCPGCTAITFCSSDCRAAALAGYHGRECGTLGVLAASALNNFALIAMRAVCRSTAKERLAASVLSTHSNPEEYYPQFLKM